MATTPRRSEHTKNPQYGIWFHERTASGLGKVFARRRKSRADVVDLLCRRINDKDFKLDKVTYGRETISPEHKELFVDYAKERAANAEASA